MTRHAGILMHITSLPSPYGIGTMGEAAYEVRSFLQQAGQTYWQLLPVGPTGYEGVPPYQSFSTYAGNPYLIDLDLLAEEGLLFPEDYQNLDWGDRPGSGVDFEGFCIITGLPYCAGLLNRENKGHERLPPLYKKNRDWLVVTPIHGGKRPPILTRRHGTNGQMRESGCIKRKSVERYQSLLKEDVSFWKYVQYLFFTNGNG